MSYHDFRKAIKLLELNRKYCEFICPQSDFNIFKAEELLNLKFPNSYIQFLRKYGSLDFVSQDIFGLTNNNDFSTYIYENIVCNTLDQRKINIDPPFPRSFIPIHALGNGELSCLDTSQMNKEGECPVVAWYFGATLPNGKYEVLAEDFGAFLLEKIQWGLESLEEEEKNTK